MPRPQGELLQIDLFDHTGGLNTTDSPFRVTESQTVRAYNYDYASTGGFKKRNGNTRLATDAVLRTTGTYVHSDISNNKTYLRATSSVLQTVNPTSGSTTSVTKDDSSASTSIFSTTLPVMFSPFTTTQGTTSWMVGGGISSGTIIGYIGPKCTDNGAAPFQGEISVTDSGSGSSSLTTGTYYYSVVAYKTSTMVTSNAALDASVSITTGHNALVSLANISSYDTTKYTQIWIYRSVVSGSEGFTSGDLVAKISYNGSSYSVIAGGGSILNGSIYVDEGSFLTTSDSVPRAGNTSLDQSILPTTTFSAITTYRRRLVTASGSTLYFSDLNKPESWPTQNFITIPTGGAITGLAVVNFNTPTTSSINEVLVVFKERELWVVTGSTFTTLTTDDGAVVSAADIALLFIDYVGCPAQSLVVNANGFLFWMDYRGVYFWDGANKPVYCSRPIEREFSPDGDIDRSNLNYGVGVFSRKQNSILWFISSLTYGVNKLVLKLDLRLTLSQEAMTVALVGRILEGVFAWDYLPYDVMSATSGVLSSNEIIYGGGSEGRIWSLYDNPNSDDGTAIEFSYRTKPIDCSMIGTTKRFHKVIVWCQAGNTNNLRLNFWTDYRILGTYQSTQYEQISNQNVTGIWDVTDWDSSAETDFWDSTNIFYTPVVFNLNSADLGTEGQAITLEVQQQDLNSPVSIAGISIIYSTLGVRS